MINLYFNLFLLVIIHLILKFLIYIYKTKLNIY